VTIYAGSAVSGVDSRPFEFANPREFQPESHRIDRGSTFTLLAGSCRTQGSARAAKPFIKRLAPEFLDDIAVFYDPKNDVGE
jgi:hypothetical protein